METKTIVAIQQDEEAIKILSTLGCQIVEAGDCIEGLRLILRHQPVLVVSIMKMPNFNGIAMAEIMELFQIQTPIIFTSTSIKDQKRLNDLSGNHGFLVLEQVESRLLPLVNEKLSEPPKPVGNLKYMIRQREWADLSSNEEKKRILIIDDSAWVKKACMMSLDQLDSYALFSAKDGLDGIIKALLIQPDLILTDLHMPNLDGLAMSQIFFVLNQAFPIVFLTGDENHNLSEKTKRIGGILGVILKTELRNQALFHQTIMGYLNDCEENHNEIVSDFQKGSSDLLAENEKKMFLEGKGLCTPGTSFRPGTHHISALRKGAGGLGDFFG